MTAPISSRPQCEFLAREVFDLDVGRPLPSLRASRRPTGGRYERGFALIRLNGEPLGDLELDLSAGVITAEDLAGHTWSRLAGCITSHLEEHGLPPVSRLGPEGLKGGVAAPSCLAPAEDLPPISVVIATRGRPGALAVCLDSFRRIDYPSYELIVVDNAPIDSETADVVNRAASDLPGVRYVVEKTPGSSRARNRGIAESSGDLIAFTDDDVLVSSQWLLGFVRGFREAEEVGCVTGLVLPAEFETPSQLWFERYGGFSRGYERKVFDLEPPLGETPIYPFNAGAFGAGASMAFRAGVLRDLGGFDIALGPGTPAKGGEDLDLFLRVILAGYRLVYEPSTVAWHRHRRDYPALRRQIHDYGVGLAALIMKLLLEPATVLEVIRRVPYGLVFLLSPSSPKHASKLPGYPRVLSLVELAGMLKGPLAYLCSRSQARADEYQ